MNLLRSQSFRSVLWLWLASALWLGVVNSTPAQEAAVAVPGVERPAERLTHLENAVPDGVYRPIELGAHHRVMQKLTEIQGPDGFPTTVTNSYVELATGLHVWSDTEGKWVEASDDIEIGKEGGAFARKSQHQVGFADNLNDPAGTIDLLTPDHKRLRSRVMGLAYTEADTGKSVFIAEVKDTPGFVVGRNQVIYMDAFDAVKADVRYTTTRSSFEQDVIVREQLPKPEEFGLKSETTRLEVWTEFLEAPEPEKRAAALQRRDGKVEADEALSYGLMQIGSGKAFTIGEEAAGLAGPDLEFDQGMPVGKTYAVIDGQQFLIEAVPYGEAGPELQKLPKPNAQREKFEAFKALASVPQGQRARPQRVAAVPTRPGHGAGQGQMARMKHLRAQKGFLLDYVVMGSVTNYTFRGDTTYSVTNEVYLAGTTTIEGGTVIKFARDNYPSYRVWLWANGPVICQTSSYRPAIFTAKDDDTCGEVVSGSTGTPTGTYAQFGFHVDNVGSAVDMAHCRFLYQYVGLDIYGNSNHTARDCAFIKCAYGVLAASSSASVRNGLFHQSSVAALRGYASALTGEHLTINDANKVFYNKDGISTLLLTNSLLAAIATPTTDYTNHHGVNLPSSSGLFQTVGAGSHYLAAGSPYRNAGTTAINATLAADLKKKTTYPPILLTGNINSDTTLSSQAQRDTDAPDLGYHYDALDYLLSEVTVSNATLLLTNGVAIGTYGTRGLRLGAGGKLYSQGIPTAPNRLGHISRVQEQPSLVAGTVNYAWLEISSSGPPRPELRLVHSDVSLFGSPDHRSLAVWINYNLTDKCEITDCYLRGIYADIFTPTSGGLNVILKNNRVERYYLNFLQDGATFQPYALEQRNNTFVNGLLYYTYSSAATTWTVTDNLYDTDQLYRVGIFAAANNGYRAGLAAFANDPWPKTGLIMDYVSGPMTQQLGNLGNYYYPSSGGATSLANLINAGSRSATDAGLYHHTTRTDQTKDSSTVDIGFHYVALNGSNLPVDTDGDGLPDYLEDRNGNGAFETALGETDWNSSNSQVPGASGLLVFTLLK